MASVAMRNLDDDAKQQVKLRHGLAILKNGKLRATLVDIVDCILFKDLAGHILPLNSDAALSYVTTAAARCDAGRPIVQAHCQIAPIANARAVTVATRDASHLTLGRRLNATKFQSTVFRIGEQRFDALKFPCACAKAFGNKGSIGRNYPTVSDRFERHTSC